MSPDSSLKPIQALDVHERNMRTLGEKSIYFFSIAMLVTFFSGCNDSPKNSEITPATEFASTPATLPTNPELGDPALALLKKLNMGSNLELMAYQVAVSTHTYGLVAQRHGADRAELILKMKIKEALPQYQERWDKNLASAYSKQLSDEELRSLAAQEASSPYATKFMSVRGAVAVDMKSESSTLLNDLVTTALSQSVNDN